MAMPLRPISHTVVRPWVTASYACFTAQACFWATVSMTQSLSLSVRLPEKWMCVSTMPGMMVRPEMSRTS